MKDRKEYIIDKAFEVFMAKGYDSASMTVLQQELKMSRGAMYRYFEGKDDLFKVVIDKYFFRLLTYLQPEDDPNMTVSEKIEKSYQQLSSISQYFDNIEGLDIKFLNYTALLIQAAKRYPGFLDRMKTYKETERKSWTLALENSKSSGEIREDTDISLIAQILSRSFNMSETNTPGESFQNSADYTRKMMRYVLSLIEA